MGLRSQLHEIFEDFADNVYYQPPTNMALIYPCIVYKKDNADTDFADDIPYVITRKYMVTVIDENPDSTISDQVAKLRSCVHNRSFAAGQLNHDVYTLHF